jgi:integrase/recombinase XerD
LADGSSSEADAAPTRDWRAALSRLQGAYAAKTLHGYEGDFGVFEHWCRSTGLDALPATAETMSRFVEVQSGHVAPRTVTRRLTAIRRVHRLFGLNDASRDEGVALAIRRGLRLHGRRPRQALGLSATLRDRLIEACPATLKGARDRALIAVGYDTLCRRGELTALRIEDLVPLSGGGAKILVRRAKNDPYGEGEPAYISDKGLRHLEAWLDMARLSSGPMFRPIFKTTVGKPGLHPCTVNRVLQAAASEAGCDALVVAQLTAHSMRVGPAQDLAIAGYSALQIMRAGRWRNLDAVSTYIRAADVNIWTKPKSADHAALNNAGEVST